MLVLHVLKQRHIFSGRSPVRSCEGVESCFCCSSAEGQQLRQPDGLVVRNGGEALSFLIMVLRV